MKILPKIKQGQKNSIVSMNQASVKNLITSNYLSKNDNSNNEKLKTFVCILGFCYLMQKHMLA